MIEEEDGEATNCQTLILSRKSEGGGGTGVQFENRGLTGREGGRAGKGA